MDQNRDRNIVISGAVLVLVIGLVLFFVLKNGSEGINFSNADYQDDPPPTDLQNDYYQCLSRECEGNTYNYDCTQKCYLKSYRKGMMPLNSMGNDIQSMVCSQYSNDERTFYRCLDQVYADYKYP